MAEWKKEGTRRKMEPGRSVELGAGVKFGLGGMPRELIKMWGGRQAMQRHIKRSFQDDAAV